MPPDAERIPPIRMLLLEDNPAVAMRLIGVFTHWANRHSVTHCMYLSEALEWIDSQAVDLLIADLDLPDGNGIDAIAALHQRAPQSHSIVLSTLNDQLSVLRALKAGATGYIWKDDDSVQLIDAVEAILAGHSPISAGIARHLVDWLLMDSRLGSNESMSGLQPMSTGTTLEERGLTDREQEVLQALAKGYTNREIGDLLGISRQTVPVHVRNIYRKLQASNRTEAAYEARARGILSE